MRSNPIFRVVFIAFVIVVTAALTGCQSSSSSSSASEQQSKKGNKPETIRLDYAYYSPTSLVLKEKGWAEEAFAKEGIEVEFVLSLGSNKAYGHS